jgi:pyruvate kinase
MKKGGTLKRNARKTKIVATLGPASSTPAMIKRLIKAGVDIFRLNFSHGDYKQKLSLIKIIRETSEKTGKHTGILADLQGPKIRTGKMKDDSMLLVKGQEVVITTEDILGAGGVIPTIYKSLPGDVVIGSRILLDDGLLELKVTDFDNGKVKCLVVAGGVLKNNKGINLPGVKVSAPSLTDKDLLDLDFALEAGVDFVALSFVRTASDVESIKRIIYLKGKNTLVVAKIEKPEAIKNFKEILRVTDAVMVARGDLGVEVEAEKVPFYQKKIIKACIKAGKPVITATQMLESMIHSPRPTRAETSDVANAIIDGTDAIMLSAETAAGEYPIESVTTMNRIANDVEHSGFSAVLEKRLTFAPSIAEAVAESACRAATSLSAKALVVFTQSGGAAALISKFRPQIPIMAFTSSKEIQNRLSIYWGVKSECISITEDMDQSIHDVEEVLLKSGFRKGDIVVIIMGTPVNTRGSTNLIRIHTLGAGRYFEIY